MPLTPEQEAAARQELAAIEAQIGQLTAEPGIADRMVNALPDGFTNAVSKVVPTEIANTVGRATRGFINDLPNTLPNIKENVVKPAVNFVSGVVDKTGPGMAKFGMDSEGNSIPEAIGLQIKESLAGLTPEQQKKVAAMSAMNAALIPTGVGIPFAIGANVLAANADKLVENPTDPQTWDDMGKQGSQMAAIPIAGKVAQNVARLPGSAAGNFFPTRGMRAQSVIDSGSLTPGSEQFNPSNSRAGAAMGKEIMVTDRLAEYWSELVKELTLRSRQLNGESMLSGQHATAPMAANTFKAMQSMYEEAMLMRNKINSQLVDPAYQAVGKSPVTLSGETYFNELWPAIKDNLLKNAFAGSRTDGNNFVSSIDAKLTQTTGGNLPLSLNETTLIKRAVNNLISEMSGYDYKNFAPQTAESAVRNIQSSVAQLGAIRNELTAAELAAWNDAGQNLGVTNPISGRPLQASDLSGLNVRGEFFKKLGPDLLGSITGANAGGSFPTVKGGMVAAQTRGPTPTQGVVGGADAIVGSPMEIAANARTGMMTRANLNRNMEDFYAIAEQLGRPANRLPNTVKGILSDAANVGLVEQSLRLAPGSSFQLGAAGMDEAVKVFHGMFPNFFEPAPGNYNSILDGKWNMSSPAAAAEKTHYLKLALDGSLSDQAETVGPAISDNKYTPLPNIAPMVPQAPPQVIVPQTGNVSDFTNISLPGVPQFATDADRFNSVDSIAEMRQFAQPEGSW